MYFVAVNGYNDVLVFAVCRRNIVFGLTQVIN